MRFLSKQVQVKWYLTLKRIFGMEENARKIKVKCLVIDDHSSCSMIIGATCFQPTRGYLIYVVSMYEVTAPRWVSQGHLGRSRDLQEILCRESEAKED